MMARLNEDNKLQMYRIYTTDALKVLSGGHIGERYYDWIDTTPPDPRTAEDIIAHVRGKLGGKRGENA